MAFSYTGGCHCGAVRYEGRAEPELTFFCHCVDCQKESGGPFSVELYVSRDSVSISGELHEYTVIGDSGNAVTRKFCETCSSPIVIELAGDPEHLCIKAGSLDDASWLSPQMHLYTAKKQPWVHVSDDLPQYPGDLEE